ncbi:hypothetical protein BH23GEM6_BH23GEM6_03050 [soil metagenome]
MRSLWFIALSACLLVTACKIERTPQEYIDHRSPVYQVRQASAEELEGRLTMMGRSMEIGDMTAFFEAVPVAADGYLITDMRAEHAVGSAEIRNEMEDYLQRARPLRAEGPRVTIGPRGNTAWFLIRLEGVEGGSNLNMTGMFVRGDEGRWQMVQSHLSGLAASIQPQSYPAVDETLPAGG